MLNIYLKYFGLIFIFIDLTSIFSSFAFFHVKRILGNLLPFSLLIVGTIMLFDEQAPYHQPPPIFLAQLQDKQSSLSWSKVVKGTSGVSRKISRMFPDGSLTAIGYPSSSLPILGQNKILKVYTLEKSIILNKLQNLKLNTVLWCLNSIILRKLFFTITKKSKSK